MTPTLNPDTEFEQLYEIVLQAQKDAAGDQPVDLSDLAGRTDRLCTHISSLPSEESRPLAGRLKKLVGDLDDLAEQLARLSAAVQHEPAKGQLGSAGPRG